MDIVNLKTQIENKTLDDSLLVMVCHTNSFIVARQYIEEIARFKGLRVKYVNSINDFIDYSDTTFGEIIPFYLTVLNVKEFKPYANDFSQYKDAIVVCESIDDSLKLVIDNVVDIPKLVDWQISGYIKKECNGLNDGEIGYLQKLTNNNIERIDNELSKMKIFPVEEQDKLFAEIDEDKGFGDLSTKTIFTLTDAILKKDCVSAREVLKEIESIDVEGVGMVTILLNNFTKILGIQTYPKKSDLKKDDYDLLNVTEKQYSAIKYYNCYRYSEEGLKNIYEFLVNFDYDLKSGRLQMSNSTLIDYIICNIMSVR